MRVAIAGGRGFLGSALRARLRTAGHDVTTLSRSDLPGWRSAISGSDAVVNLAGEPIDARWTAARKKAILDSRVATTRTVVDAVLASPRPLTLFSASGVGFYGPHGDEPLTEDAPAGNDFLAQVCVAWEREAMRAAAHSRVVLLRTGLVLDRRDGALPRLALPFLLFAGGPSGSGRQWWSWIHVDDWVGLAVTALTDPHISGPMNLTAPNPVTNREFAATLGEVLNRPAFLAAPAFALRLALGEMADGLILNGQRVLPERAQQAGYRFTYPDLDAALRAIYP
jgi:uncharacterized protein (TIGR01777 family)